MAQSRSAKISIDLTALQHNFERVKDFSPDSKIMPVIKANAYGHGMLQIAQSLSQADGFAVAQLSEAVRLRQGGIVQPITVFQGFANQSQLEEAINHKLRPAISQLWQIDLLESIDANHVIDVWLKVNTGMGRLGLQEHEVETAWKRLKNIKSVNQSGLLSHFANADVPEHLSNQKQIACFESLSQLLSTETSLSNSGGIVNRFLPQQNWVRPGIMLYGASPVADRTATELGLKPVMSINAELIAINQMQKGQAVGYGDGWICPEPMPVGIINIGYGDGYPRHAVPGTPVLVAEQRAGLIGRVSMDSIAVDLRGVQAKCGDAVELWGKALSVDEVAANADTIAYELLCNVGSASLDLK